MRATKRDLKSYRTICNDIEMLEWQISREAVNVSDVVQSSAERPYNLHNVTVKGTVYPPEVTQKQKQLTVLKLKRKAIEDFIDGIDDYIIRRSLELLYIEPKDDRITWEDVAMHIDNGSSGDAIRRRVSRYLQMHCA